MALVKCKECDAQVSDSAASCPHCGISKPGGGVTGKLVIIRPSALTGAIHPVHVFVDGQVVGEVRNGSTLAIEVAKGRREVEVRGHGGMSRSVVTYIEESKTVTYQLSFSALGIFGGGLNFDRA